MKEETEYKLNVIMAELDNTRRRMYRAVEEVDSITTALQLIIDEEKDL